MKILAVDPGEHNGYAVLTLNDEKRIVDPRIGTLLRLPFYKELSLLVRGVNVIVAEDFLVRPRNAKKGDFDWNPVPAAQVIGALEFLATNLAIPIVRQQPSIKPMGYSYVGKKYVKGAKSVHEWDALAHGVYYLVRHHSGEPLVVSRLKQQSQQKS
jgi:hypothetical protein